MGVIVYTSSASASAAVKNKQKAIIDYLKSRKIEFEEIDLCVHTDAKDIMRSKIPEDIKKKNEEEKKVVIPPQVFNDDEYCGDYDMFFAAREMELLHTFFKVPASPEEKKKLKSINWSSVEDKENDGNAENVPTGELADIAEQADIAESDAKGMENGTDRAEEKEGESKDQDEAENKSENAEEKMEDAEKVDKADPGGDANVSNEDKQEDKDAKGESAEAGGPQDTETDKEPEAAATE